MMSLFPVFEGQIDKIVIDSEMSLFMLPPLGTEIRQKITLRNQGKVSVTRYYMGDYEKGAPFKNNTKKMNRYKVKYTEKLMYYISAYFSEEHYCELLRDCGSWEAELTNTKGEKWTFRGNLGDVLSVGGLNISSIVRKTLELPDLWMFDGDEENTAISAKTIG